LSLLRLKINFIINAIDSIGKSIRSFWRKHRILLGAFWHRDKQFHWREKTKGITPFDIRIGKDLYSINLNKNFQILKDNPYRCRPILRASAEDKIKVVRKNRFANIIEPYTQQNNSIKSHSDEWNLQVKIQVYGFCVYFDFIGFLIFGKPAETNSVLLDRNFYVVCLFSTALIRVLLRIPFWVCLFN